MFGYQSSLEERLYKLNRELMCPVCEGLTLEQSQSSIAIEMREEIKKMDKTTFIIIYNFYWII